MKKMFVALMVVAMTLSAGLSSVEAKRMGGGGSFGKKSQSMSRQQATPAQNQAAARAAPPAAAAAAPAAGAAGAAGAAAKPSMMKGLLGGALLGLGLGALLSHFGMGGALASMISTILMVALFAFAAMFIYRRFIKKPDNNGGMKPAFGGANAPSSFNNSFNQNASSTPEIGSALPTQRNQFETPATSTISNFGGATAANTILSGNDIAIPADFDTAGFLRHAKINFIRLQAAWDKADADDIREFTTPEMFGELKMQLQERGASANSTDVITIDAEFLNLEMVGSDYMAGVKFSGMIKDDPTKLAEPFNEVWNLTKPANGTGGWLLAGIEQV